MRPINLAIILALGTFSLNGLADGSLNIPTDVESDTTYQTAPVYEDPTIQAEEVDPALHDHQHGAIEAEEDASFYEEDMQAEEEELMQEEEAEDTSFYDRSSEEVEADLERAEREREW